VTVALADVGAATSARVGRYFDVITFIPTTILVTYVYVLTQTHAWTGTPDWTGAAHSVADLSAVAVLAVTSLAVSLLLHPLQFAMTQLLEGYWGVSRPARTLMTMRVRAHRDKRLAAQTLSSQALIALGVQTGGSLPSHVKKQQIAAVVAFQESQRLLQMYPDARAATMPTRLGNVLRRYETQAGSQYGLPVIRVAPHLSLVAPAAHWAYVTDQRTTMDRSVRLFWLSALATFASTVFLWRSAWWLLIAALPYLCAYLSYRGAVVVAAEYGTACATVLDVNRFELYERLGYPRPTTSDEERRRNRLLLQQIERKPVHARYREPSDPGTGT
jgi:hypothetical protein